MNPTEKQAARDKIAALKARWERTENTTAFGQARAMAHARYVNALAALVDELTAPEQEDLCLKRRVAVWNAINQYVEACGGRSGDGVYGNVARPRTSPDPPLDSRGLTESFGSTELGPGRNPE